MFDGLKGLVEVRAYALSRAQGVSKLGMERLKAFEFFHELVKFAVRDFRGVIDVIELIVAV